jgi:hypothetical protein
MIKLKDILEAKAGLHPDALHVSPVKVDGKTKYQVKAVGKNFSDGIKVGEHLTDTHLDDATEMGAKIKHIKEAIDEASQAYRDAVAAHREAGINFRADNAERKLAAKAAEPKTLAQKIKKDIGTPLKHLMKGNLKKAITEEVLEEGTEAHAQFQQYHNDSSKLLKGIGGALSKHYDNVTNKKGWNGGEANWNHVAEIKGAHRQLQDLHDAILQVGEYHKPMDVKKLKEEVEPEADMNILVQLRKPIDILEHGTQGGADITFGDGQKVFVEGTVAQKLVESMEKIKPEDRVKVAEFLYQSHDNMMAVYARLK